MLKQKWRDDDEKDLCVQQAAAAVAADDDDDDPVMVQVQGQVSLRIHTLKGLSLRPVLLYNWTLCVWRCSCTVWVCVYTLLKGNSWRRMLSLYA